MIQNGLYAIRIDKGKFVTQLSQSENYRGEITVRNDSQLKTEVTVYLEDFEYTAPYEGAKEFYSPGTKNNSIAGWINFSPQKFILPAYGSKQVGFIVKPDEKVSATHCGVLFFETPLGSVESGAGISLVGRVGSLLFINPKRAQREVTFSEITGNYYKITGQLANSGNTFLGPKTTYYIMDSGGMVKDRGQLDQLYLLPEDKTWLEIIIPKKLSFGRYTTVLTFDLGKGDVLVKEIDFLVNGSGEIEILEVRD
ncbi:MAG: hypothetical protein K9L69_00885 [Candidatus Omnitrophica bacterium]|nr:hypothetical protein [Candidatus Omnitrophota bacterium]MCF7894680.1 hypothetical protein [Candidatus Omnitrophota bacterium]